jgi:acetyl esterase/lipase
MRKPSYIHVRAIIFVTTVLFIRPVGAQQIPIEVDPGFGLSTIALWEGPAPGALGSASEDTPALTVFPPQHGKGNGAAVVVAPGGGYMGRASNIEGRQVADWFNSRGFVAFVLKYRLGAKYLYPIPLNDASRAIRLVRSQAARLGFDPTRIGMIGFSAGGHLAAMLGATSGAGDSNAKDPVDRLSRPDFIVLGYPWLNAMQPSHPGGTPSYQMLMNVPRERQADFVQPYTPLFHVTPRVPPTFIFITADDPTVSVRACLEYYGALRAAGVPAEMHIFEHGPHGVGLGSGDPALDLWPMLMDAWLRGLRILR